jgi:DNA polymerase phi
LLSLLPELPVGLFLYHLHQTSESNGKKSGQEEREFYFARIFGYYAMALSGMLTSVPSAPFMTSLTQERNFTATIDEINSMVENLLECCKQKDYLKVSATFCALQVLNALQSHPTGAATLSDVIIKKWLENGISTPEHVWFALEAQRIHPTCSAWSTLLADWKKTDILYSKNKSKLLEILKNASFYHENQEFMASPIQNEKQVSFSSLHPIFQALVDGMQTPPPSSCRMNLFEFWGLIEPFFFASHSHDRKSMGFLFLTQLVVPCCQPNQISLVFTKLFMRCLINSLSSSDTKLNKQARFTVFLSA